LVVDVSKPYADDSFFEIERALLAGRPHATCGGRSLNDDVMDTLYTLLINADTGPRVSDGVDQATVEAGRLFPYLAPPNPPAGADGGPGSPTAEKAPPSCPPTPARATLEPDDSQAGPRRARPSPYVGVDILLRVDDSPAGRQLLRLLQPALRGTA